MIDPRRSRICDFHGLRLGYFGDPAILEAIDLRFGRFAPAEPGACDIRFDYHSVTAAGTDERRELPPDVRPVYESPMGQVLYSDRADRLYIRSVWPIRAACDPRSGETNVDVAGALVPHLWALSHPILTIPLIETAKRRARFSVHAAGVAIGEKGLVLAGSTGSGKSTLALALARAGFGFLGDDMLFLERTERGLRALGLPEAFDLTDDTLRLFPDLEDLLRAEKQPGWPKHQLRVEERFGAPIVHRCRPVGVVFPRVAPSGRTSLAPMDRQEALLEILPNILLTERDSSQQHLDVLSELIAGAAPYRLETGRDFDEVARRLRDLLEAAP